MLVAWDVKAEESPPQLDKSMATVCGAHYMSLALVLEQLPHSLDISRFRARAFQLGTDPGVSGGTCCKASLAYRGP